MLRGNLSYQIQDEQRQHVPVSKKRPIQLENHHPSKRFHILFILFLEFSRYISKVSEHTVHLKTTSQSEFYSQSDRLILRFSARISVAGTSANQTKVGVFVTMSTFEMTDFAPRPGYGTKGRKIQYFTNFFEVVKFPQNLIHHYDVDTVPPMKPREAERVWSVLTEMPEFKADTSSTPFAYDGKRNIFAAAAFPSSSKVYQVNLGKVKDFIFEVTIKKVNEINMQGLADYLAQKTHTRPFEAIMALDIIFRQHPMKTLLPVGRAFYMNDKPFKISGGAEIWQGLSASVRPAKNRLLLNVDLAATAFLEPKPLVEVMQDTLRQRVDELLRRGDLPPRESRQVTKVLKGKMVNTTHSKSAKQYKVWALTPLGADKTMFQVDDGKEMSVAAYFSERYGMTLKYPGLPMVHVEPKKRNIYIPMELCKLAPGQRIAGKLDGKQTADMIKFTAQKPDVRKRNIMEGLPKMVPQGDALLNAFGVQVNPQMLTVDARVLDPPTVQYRQDSRAAVVTPRDGTWRLQDTFFFKAMPIQDWGVLVLDQQKFMPTQAVGGFIECLHKMALECGMTMPNVRPPLKYCDTRNFSGIEASIKELCQEIRTPRLIVVILPSQDTMLYGEVKRVCDTVVDVPSQCLLSNQVKKKQLQYCKNVLLKINVKLGGINSVLQKTPAWNFFFSQPAIVFGADVTHATFMSKLPSIAAVVASMDQYAYRYSSRVQSQSHGLEMIVNLKDMVKSLLIEFFKATNFKPAKILFYRDGVSEGQFLAVARTEILAIKEACQSLEASYNPTVTFVVARKRHSGRFFPQSSRDADKSGNVRAGSVIDSGITSPHDFDFYLSSHAGLQGTNRPCLYNVLYDENRFSADFMHELTNSFCYGYARCTRSVSIVPPAYYAHLVAFRARFHTQSGAYDETRSVTSSDSGNVEFYSVKRNTASVMYFM